MKETIDIPINLLGDTICCLTAVKYYIKSNGLEGAQIFTNYKNIVNLSELGSYCVETPYPSNIINVVNFGDDIRFKPNQHLIDNAFATLVDDISSIDISQKNTIRYVPRKKNKFDFDDRYVILNCSFTDNRRRFSNEVMNDIINFLVKSDLNPVFVGKSKDQMLYDIDYSLGLNMIDKTSLEDLLMLCSASGLLITADGGMLHIGGMTDIAILTFSTIGYPKYVLPIRNNEIGYNIVCLIPQIECRFCCSKSKNWWNDCRQKDTISECVKSLKSDEIIYYLELYRKEVISNALE